MGSVYMDFDVHTPCYFGEISYYLKVYFAIRKSMAFL